MGLGSKVKKAAKKAKKVVKKTTNVVQDVQKTVVDPIKDKVISPLVSAAVEVKDIADDIKDNLDPYIDKVQDAYGVVDHYVIEPLKPLIKAADIVVEDLPIVGNIYATGKNVYTTSMAVIETAKNYYDLYRDSIPDEAEIYIEEVQEKAQSFFKFLGWA